MITPFTNDNQIDYSALEQMIDWYINHKADGLFAVCQSSEMWHLSLKERVDLAQFTVQKTDSRIPVIASNRHIVFLR